MTPSLPRNIGFMNLELFADTADGCPLGYRRIAPVLAGYSLSEYAVAYDVCIKIIQDVRPACVANDMLFPMGFDACHALKVPALRISPLSLQHEAADAQPKLAAFWKYPLSVFFGVGDNIID